MPESFRDFEHAAEADPDVALLGFMLPVRERTMDDGRRAVMCYEQEFLRYWATRRAEKRQRNEPVTERDRPPPMPIRPAATPEVERRQKVESELEEIV
jgi:hypothetical protein